MFKILFLHFKCSSLIFGCQSSHVISRNFGFLKCEAKGNFSFDQFHWEFYVGKYEGYLPVSTFGSNIVNNRAILKPAIVVKHIQIRDLSVQIISLSLIHKIHQAFVACRVDIDMSVIQMYEVCFLNPVIGHILVYRFP